MQFQVPINPILWWGDLQAWSATQPKKAESTYWHATSKDKEGAPSISQYNYLAKFSPSMAEVCQSLTKLMSAKTEWTWNATYQKMFDKAKAIIKEDACMKFYDETKAQYIETDASGVGLGAALLQTRSNANCHRDEALDNSILGPTAFSSKSLTEAEKRYSNTEREALGILCGL